MYSGECLKGFAKGREGCGCIWTKTQALRLHDISREQSHTYKEKIKMKYEKKKY